MLINKYDEFEVLYALEQPLGPDILCRPGRTIKNTFPYLIPSFVLVHLLAYLTKKALSLSTE